MAEDAHTGLTRPAGKAWPPALRHALKIPESASSNDEEAREMMTLNPSTSFTTSQLRQYIHRSYATLSSLQRQLHRGEESYFEESYAHGNLFSGWDNIWIEGNPAAATDTNSGSSAGGDAAAPAQKAATMRKMPNDYRWFSGSCGVSAKGDARVASILGRESLLEPPPSELTSVSKVEATSDSSPTKRSMPVKSNVAPKGIGPANKKSKLENINTESKTNFATKHTSMDETLPCETLSSAQQPSDSTKTPQRSQEFVSLSTASAEKPQDVLSSPSQMNVRVNNPDQSVATAPKEVIDSDMDLDSDESTSSKNNPSGDNLIHSPQLSATVADNEQQNVKNTGKSEVQAGKVDDVTSSSVQAQSEVLAGKPTSQSSEPLKAKKNISSSVPVKVNDKTVLPPPDHGTSKRETTPSKQVNLEMKPNMKPTSVASSTESAQRASVSINKVNKTQTSSDKPGNQGFNQRIPKKQISDDSFMQQRIPKKIKPSATTETSEAKPPPVSETATKSDAKVEKAADNNSDEDQTLSEIVQMKSKTITEAKTPSGKRTSKRRRSPT